MSSTPDSQADHEYFRAIEETFIRLRGAPLLLSPSDWQLAKRWRQEGIPVQLVLTTLENVFASRAARGSRGPVQGLRYCAPAIDAAWQEHRVLTATGARRPGRTVDVKARLEAIVENLRSHPQIPAQVKEQVLALEGPPEEVEQRLVELDREVLAMAMDQLDRDLLEKLEDSVNRSIRQLESRLSSPELQRVRERLLREGVRRHLGFPVLSLFAIGPEID